MRLPESLEADGFTLKGHVESDTFPKGLAEADIDADGHLDLTSATQWGYSIHLFCGDGLGGFVPANELNGDGEPTRVLVGDFNNDGKLDLVTNAQEEGNVLIYFGDGTGPLAARRLSWRASRVTTLSVSRTSTMTAASIS